MTGIGFSQGDPNLVLYPYDEDGKQCGRSNGTLYNYTSYPYIYFYAAVSNVKDYNVTGLIQGVCVSSCPKNFTGSLLTPGTIDCMPTTKNPNCQVLKTDFYDSISCILFF